jgi:signal transduction histidine kinase
MFCLVFPNGRLVPRWTALVIPLVVVQAVGVVAPPDSPVNANHAPDWINAAVALAVYGTIIGSQIYRFRRRSTPTERQQAKWVVFGIVFVALGYLALNIIFHVGLLPPDNPWTTLLQIAYPLLNFLFPLTISIAILRSRLWDIDAIISRTLVYGVLTASVIGVYVLIVGYLGAALHSEGNLVISLIATGIVAMLFQPWRDYLQRSANRLLYGLRDEPYVVMAGLGQRVQSTLDPAALLSTIVSTVRETLKLSYAAIEVSEGSRVALTSAGAPPASEPLRLTLVYQNAPVGALLVAPRNRDGGLTSADLRLLSDLALQIGAAVHMLRLSGDLQRSRERLVTAREEERRRLRRDLHDGLGPMLSAILLKVGITRALQRREPGAADALLGQLETEIELAISDIRRLVYNLRPPALDELGLVGAIRDYMARLDPVAGESASTLKVTVAAPDELPPLAAAVEVAAYRIVQEAVTNVIRHAHASACHIHILITEFLRIDITDDGAGMAETDRLGVGLTSMRERAEELGGELIIGAGDLGGTHITARLPLGIETASGEPL